VYTDDRRIDAVMLAQDNDIVLVPQGYHPVVSAYGYTSYYLNFLAGSAHSLANVDDPAYSWVKKSWTEIDSRLPLVDHGMEGLVAGSL
jgi:5-deoxy-glucuronate isomerase